MNGLLYIQLARSIFQSKSEEEIRCAISRYYYGLLHLTIEKLVKLDNEYDNLKANLISPPDGYSIHGSTIADLKSVNPAIGADLDIVRKLRVISDYNFEVSVLKNLDISYTKKKTEYKREFKTKDEILEFLNDVLLRIDKLEKSKTPKKSGFNTMESALFGISKRLKK